MHVRYRKAGKKIIDSDRILRNKKTGLIEPGYNFSTG
jgi:hypothetical protein